MTLNPIYLIEALEWEAITYKFDLSMNELSWESFIDSNYYELNLLESIIYFPI